MVLSLIVLTIVIQTDQSAVVDPVDLRLGLHTHMGYPKELARDFDRWLVARNRPPVHWDRADLQCLVAHANAFNPSLLSHGGLAWRVFQKGYELDADVAANAVKLRLKNSTDIRIGDWLFFEQEIMEITGILHDGFLEVKRYQVEARKWTAGTKCFVYTSGLTQQARLSLETLDVDKILAQIVVMPDPTSLPVPFRHVGWHSAGHVACSAWDIDSDPFYGKPQFKPPHLSERGIPIQPRFANQKTVTCVRNTSPFTLSRFVRQQFSQFIRSIIFASRCPSGQSKIAYWLVGNEPDSLIGVEPGLYAQWVCDLKNVLDEEGHRGKIVLANVNGDNPEFRIWLDAVGDAFVDLMEKGELDSTFPPFQAASITFYVDGQERTHDFLEKQTQALRRSIGMICSLFDKSSSIEFLVKELGLRASNEPLTESEAQPAVLETLAKLKSLGYAHVVWFNQMPVGDNHGALIDDCRFVCETEFGRFMRHLNQSAPNSLPIDTPKRRAKRESIDIPDPAYRAFILERYDDNENGQLEQDEANRITKLHFTHPEIRDLAGTQHFHNIRELNVYRTPVALIPNLSGLLYLKTLGISESVLNAFPSMPSGLTKIILRSNLQMRVPDFSGFPRLNRVELNDQHWTRLPKMPTGLKYLHCWKMTLNGGIELPDNLDTLRLVSCTVDFSRVAAIPGLYRLSCFNTDLNTLGDVNRFSSLRELDIYGSDLDELPEGHEKLCLLKISGSKLKEADILDFPNLEELDLTNNQISFVRLNAPRLKKIDLPVNSIGSVEGLETCPLIEDLNLRNNDLSSLSGLGAALQVLQLDRNEFTELPDLRQCANLVFLDVSENQIQSLPDLSHMRDLTYVYASGNLMSEVPRLDWSYVNLLRLSGQSITDLPDTMLMGKITELNCKNNMMRDICPEIALTLAQNRWGKWVWDRSGTTLEEDALYVWPQQGDYREHCDHAVAEKDAFRNIEVDGDRQQLVMRWFAGSTRDESVEEYHIGPANVRQEVWCKTTQTGCVIQRGFDAESLISLRAVDSSQQILDEAVIDFQPHAEPIVTRIMPHVARVPQWKTTIHLNNPTDLEVVIAVTPMGSATGPLTQPMLVTLPIKGSVSFDLGTWFGDELVGQSSWLHLASDSWFQASFSYALNWGGAITEQQTSPSLARAHVLPVLHSAHDQWNGLVMVNPNASDTCRVDVGLLNERGEFVAERTVDLEPYEKWVGLVEVFLNTVEPELGSLHINSDVPIETLLLHGGMGTDAYLTGFNSADFAGQRSRVPTHNRDVQFLAMNTTSLLNKIDTSTLDTDYPFWLRPLGTALAPASKLAGPEADSLRFFSDAPILAFNLERIQTASSLRRTMEATHAVGNFGRRFFLSPVVDSMDFSTELLIHPVDPWNRPMHPWLRITAFDANGSMLAKVTYDADTTFSQSINLRELFPSISDVASLLVESPDGPVSITRMISSNTEASLWGVTFQPLPE